MKHSFNCLMWLLKLIFKCRENKGIKLLKSVQIKVAGDRYCSSVCIDEKSMHEVQRLIPKCEIFTNRLRNVSAQ